MIFADEGADGLEVQTFDDFQLAAFGVDLHELGGFKFARGDAGDFENSRILAAELVKGIRD